ncbi:hypothetical protein EVAR_25139_1 [Eumeta japonica]|uniref:Uncharacterized protein n=1 Tax=Eumeta variegata TaxID=151549 RepID=A0A4C1XKM2_EUMVA|nr:hypothetical protein EVAR_25139_1 [Eumeta japonica]
MQRNNKGSILDDPLWRTGEGDRVIKGVVAFERKVDQLVFWEYAKPSVTDTIAAAITAAVYSSRPAQGRRGWL